MVTSIYYIFVQSAADNVDHNVRGIDGKGTFHGMDIIDIVIPDKKTAKHIPRKDITSEDLASVGHIRIHIFVSEKDSLQTSC